LPYNITKSLGKCPEGCPIAHESNPVHPGTGNKFQLETDYESPVQGGLKLRRYYNSQAFPSTRFGAGWFSDYYQRVRNVSGTTTKVEVVRPDGKVYPFNYVSGQWVADGRSCRDSLLNSDYSSEISKLSPQLLPATNHCRDRFTLRGQIKVNTQWLLYSIVHNLGKIHANGPGFT